MNDRSWAFSYAQAAPTCSSSYIWPTVIAEIERRGAHRVIDIGCGNGALGAHLSTMGLDVVGIDPSQSGIAQARASCPAGRFEQLGTDDDLAAALGRFPVAVSLEVVEHLFFPQRLVQVAFELLEPGGVFICSTPYHGYLKNVLISLSGKWDNHHQSLLSGAHIKFFSAATFDNLLGRAGFVERRIVRVGRIPPVAKSMIAIVRRPMDS